MRHKKVQQNISRLMALFLSLTLILVCVPAASANSGSCGTSLEWSFDGSTLTITGSGAMTDFTSKNPPPWFEYREQIQRLSLPEGLTKIGSRAFYDCVNLTSVSLPSTMEFIGEAAFYRNSSMTMLTLNQGLYSIGRKAFSQCSALVDLRLPSTIMFIKNYAFSMCSSLRYVTIPSAVTEFGSGVFSYCDSLIRVDVEADVELPGWSFYGCDKLQTVTVKGESVDPESLKKPNLPESVSDEPTPGVSDSTEEVPETTVPTEPAPVTPAPDEGFASGESVSTGSSGEQVVDKTLVTKTEDSTVISTTQTTVGQEGTGTTTITATIQNNNGWQDVMDKINSATIGGNQQTVDVTVYIPNDDTVSSGVLEELAGKNVTLNIQTQSGSRFTLDCRTLDGKIKEDLVLSYSIVVAEDVPEELEGCTVYKLIFHNSAQMSTELLVHLPGGHPFSTATLYQLSGRKKLEQLQSVLVDGSGDAHWYLSNVDEKTEYLIGIDVPGAAVDTPIIPAELHDVYKVENVYDGVEYVVTGRTSSWGMNLGQVMGILAAVMVTVIVVVGAVMFIWNKRRLKNGYVPDFDDEDE